MTDTVTGPLTRPGADEYAPYYGRYVDRVPDGDIRDVLARQLDEALAFFRALPPEMGDHRYAPEKWSVKEVVGHVADAERIFAYRALRIARADETPLPGFEENPYVANASFGDRTLESLVDEWADVRRATLSLLRGLPAEAWTRRGTASGFGVSVRGLAGIVAGHLEHHLDILRTRYLGDS